MFILVKQIEIIEQLYAQKQCRHATW